MRISYREIDTTEESLAKARQGAEHIEHAVREIRASFGVLFNSDRASAEDQGALARIHDELKAIQARVIATADAARPAVEVAGS